MSCIVDPSLRLGSGQHHGYGCGATPGKAPKTDPREYCNVPPSSVSPRPSRKVVPSGPPTSVDLGAGYTPPHAAMAMAGAYPPLLVDEPPVSANASGGGAAGLASAKYPRGQSKGRGKGRDGSGVPPAAHPLSRGGPVNPHRSAPVGSRRPGVAPGQPQARHSATSSTSAGPRK